MGWSAADKLAVVIQSADLIVTERSAYNLERVLSPEKVESLRQAAQDPNEKQLLTLKEHKELENFHVQDKREIKP